MTFDPQAFLDATTTEPAKAWTCPPGEYSPAIIEPGSIELKPWTSKDQTKSGWKLSLKWNIQDPGLLADASAEGRDRVIVKQDVMLDTDGGGSPKLDSGISLRNLREAVGMNQSGTPFSLRMLEGRMARVRVKHTTWNDSVFAEVDGVSRL
jgi:hypothetical protein